VDPETPASDTIMRPMSVHGDLGKNHDPGGSHRKLLTDQPRSKNRYRFRLEIEESVLAKIPTRKTAVVPW
jgi:hypothetical protein